jgi:thiol-disulfide isomerase/thioredoxin
MSKSSLTTVLLLSSLIFIASVQAKENKKVLIIFSAPWCQSCQIAKNDMEVNENLVETLKNYEIIEADYDVDKDLVRGYNIKTIPTFVIYSDGKEIKRKVIDMIPYLAGVFQSAFTTSTSKDSNGMLLDLPTKHTAFFIVLKMSTQMY